MTFFVILFLFSFLTKSARYHVVHSVSLNKPFNIGDRSLNRTIYCYSWDIMFTCSTYYRVMFLFFLVVYVFHIIAFDLY